MCLRAGPLSRHQPTKIHTCAENIYLPDIQYGATIFHVRHRGYSLEQKCDVSLLATLNSLLFTTQGTCCRRFPLNSFYLGGLAVIFSKGLWFSFQWRRAEVSNPHAFTCTCFQGTVSVAADKHGVNGARRWVLS